MTAPSSCQVFAILYAGRNASTHEHFYRSDGSDVPMPMAYYVWLIISDDGVILVDTGFTREVAESAGREYLACPVDSLRLLGIEPDDVTHLVLSHLHYDHTGHVGYFPNAKIFIQEREMRFWTGPDAHIGEYPKLARAEDLGELIAANLDGQLEWLDGDAQILPGVSAHLVAGHTPGMQVVRVVTNEGPVILASDASHFYNNIEHDQPYAIVHTLPEMYRAFERIRELAGDEPIIVPGHDPEVMGRFHAPSQEMEGVIVRIA